MLAGGYDAIYCITLDSQCDNAVYQLWQGWESSQITPLLCHQSRSGLEIHDKFSINGF